MKVNCLECGKYTNNEKFCNSGCAAKYNNRAYPKRRRELFEQKCEFCGKQLSRTQRYNKFCSSECDVKYRKESYIRKWLAGEETGSTVKNSNLASGYVVKYLIDKAEHKCERCGWNEANPFLGYPILEVHHKDGNRENNTVDNLIVLCPNCHSLTENYRAMNIRK